jgi:hypothetical protein
MRKTKTIGVRNKEFRISLVNNYFSVKYYEMEKELRQLEQDTLQVQLIQQEVISGKKDPIQAAEEVNLIAERVEKINVSKYFEEEMELVQEVLESNDLKFDRKWWERRTDSADIKQFLRDVYMIDRIEVKKKGGETKK